MRYLPPNKRYANGADKTQVLNGAQIYPLINGTPATQKFPTLQTVSAVYFFWGVPKFFWGTEFFFGPWSLSLGGQGRFAEGLGSIWI